MSDIRFRAWDKKTKRLLSPEYTETVMALMGWSGGDDYIYMQFTGLHDKNGKEIYEGDILEYYNATVPRGSNPVKRKVVRWLKSNASFKDCFGGEVIGNIHQNPELIEETQN